MAVTGYKDFFAVTPVSIFPMKGMFIFGTNRLQKRRKEKLAYFKKSKLYFLKSKPYFF